jgi:hypothetical protein
MASFKEHCADCMKELGKQHAQVHLWLDEYAKCYFPWMGHRIHRHHLQGVEEVRHKWGDEAARAAEIHILKDEGDVPTVEEITRRYVAPPKNIP